MQIINKLELKLEKFDKCHVQCDSDTPLGVLYDYSCAFQVFIMEKMQAAHEARKAEQPEKQTDIQPSE